MDDINFAEKLKKKSMEDERSEEVLSRLLFNHESQRKALEEERKREAAESRLLLSQASDVIVKLNADMKVRDEEILSLNSRMESLSKAAEEYRNALHTREVGASNQPGPPLSRNELDSGSESDGSTFPEETADPQQSVSKAAGSLSPSMTKEERLKAEMRKLKKSYKKLVAAYSTSEQQRIRKEKEAQQYHDQGYKYYMECGAMQRRIEMMDHERKSMTSELAHTKQQLAHHQKVGNILVHFGTL
ncbi:hypothetical protein BKA70DRAFT_1577749 [Coprinopsis sp. MPI-PUGE-AT-0042]|nr:hypothetical protein BKA70DRAFT_1577749 [Coprinopsis sp. MPI-PUGE-AT-0042]